MVFIDRESGICVERAQPPGGLWQAVPGHGTLYRRRGRSGFEAAHGFGPDAKLWQARGWEIVRFRPAGARLALVRGSRSQLRIELSEPGPGSEAGRLLVSLPDEAGRETLAEKPGAQAVFARADLEAGLPPDSLAEPLLTARIVATGLSFDRARWVLRGPPVSPDDARILRALKPILQLAERLSLDLRDAVRALGPSARSAPPRAESPSRL